MPTVYKVYRKEEWTNYDFSKNSPSSGWPPEIRAVADFLKTHFLDLGPWAKEMDEGWNTSVRAGMSHGGMIVRLEDGVPAAVMGFGYFPSGGENLDPPIKPDGCNIGFVLVDKGLRSGGVFRDLMRELTAEVAARPDIKYLTIYVDLGPIDAPETGNKRAEAIYDHYAGLGLWDRQSDIKGDKDRGKGREYMTGAYRGEVDKWIEHFKLPRSPKKLSGPSSPSVDSEPGP